MYSTYNTMDIQAASCETLLAELSERLDQFASEAALAVVQSCPWGSIEQTTLAWKPDEELTCFLFPISEQATAQELMGSVGSLAEANCNLYCPYSEDQPYILHDHPEESPREALLTFMASVLPFDLASDIFDDPLPYLDDMVISDGGPNLYVDEISDNLPVMRISNVVGTTGDVKAKLAFMQVPTQDDSQVMGLEMVWKVSKQARLLTQTDFTILSLKCPWKITGTTLQSHTD